jgi:FkbM family methyltransferase
MRGTVVAVAEAIFKLNFLPFWASEVEVWGNRVTATSLDRLVNLYLHHLGLRGQEEKRFFERHIRPGMRVLDIGANQGLYTLLISRIVGSSGCVHAFEPDAGLFASLRRNCERNGAANIEFHNVALGLAPGVMNFYRSKVNSGDNRLARSRHPAWFEEIEVRVAPLDSILTGERVDFIKIDVQGWEYQVFLGMERLLRDNPQVRIYLEYWPLGLENAGCPPLQCLRHLTTHGFSLYRTSGGSLEPLSDFEGLTRSLRGQHWEDLLAVRGALDA